jgi:UBX domain-containing protein 1
VILFVYYLCCSLAGSLRGSRALAAREANRGGPFAGTGHTLGSEEAESQVIPDPNGDSDEEETAVRNITFWRTGFTIQDGPLRSYDDAESAQLLELIQRG